MFQPDSSLLPICAKSGPIAQFLSQIGWIWLWRTLEILPIPLEDPIPPGISLHNSEAIEVNQRHDTHKRQYQSLALIGHSNMLLITWICIWLGYHMSISYTVLYSILDNVSCHTRYCILYYVRFSILQISKRAEQMDDGKRFYFPNCSRLFPKP